MLAVVTSVGMADSTQNVVISGRESDGTRHVLPTDDFTELAPNYRHYYRREGKAIIYSSYSYWSTRIQFRFANYKIVRTGYKNN